MASKTRAALSALSGAVETACGWAFCAVALYALLFVNLTGNGPLWQCVRDLVTDSAPEAAPRNPGVEVRVVPVRPPADAGTQVQNRMLMVPDVPEDQFSVGVVAPPQGPAGAGAVRLASDAPADPGAGKDWRRHLVSAPRSFTIYGEGEPGARPGVSDHISPLGGRNDGARNFR